MHMLFTNASVLTPDGFRTDVHVETRGGRIVALHAGAPPDVAETVDLGGDVLAPGFVDIQVNGGGGVLFNDRPDVDGLRTIAAAHLKSGTTSLMPTLISDDLSVVEAGIAAVAEARAAGMENILGIHIEGPFLNPEKCGIHDPDRFAELDDDAIDLLCSLETGTTLVTLAPERCRPDQIRTLVERGAIVSLGHTNGRYADARAALDAGATGFTHLFNAMPQMHSREPGIVGAALENRTAWTSLIVDGHHVDPVMLGLARRLRPADRLMLITDAMPNAGTDLTEFILQGRPIHVAGGRCSDADGVLAGADLSLAQAVRNTVELMGLPLDRALNMASRYPAEFLGLAGEVGRIAPGCRADFVRLDASRKVVATYPAAGDTVMPALRARRAG